MFKVGTILARSSSIVRDAWVALIQARRKPVLAPYPVERRRFKGRPQLRRYANGLERCIACSLCAAACPADAIFVRAAINSDDERYSPGERYAGVYEINMSRCIFCGYCEDACPTSAIVLRDDYAAPGQTRESLVYSKDMLLAAPPKPELGTPQKVQPGAHRRALLPLDAPPSGGLT
jgi:NADH-quinone oxidoreductase subunit I